MDEFFCWSMYTLWRKDSATGVRPTIVEPYSQPQWTHNEYNQVQTVPTTFVMLTLQDNLLYFKATISNICKQNDDGLNFDLSVQLVLLFTYHLLTLPPYQNMDFFRYLYLPQTAQMTFGTQYFLLPVFISERFTQHLWHLVGDIMKTEKWIFVHSLFYSSG